MLPLTQHGNVYLRGEVASQTVLVPLPASPNAFHIYCSLHCPGARQVLLELCNAFPDVTFSEDARAMASCTFYLLYLTGETWTRGHESAQLADEVRTMLRQQQNSLLLWHEMPGGGDEDRRHACPFGEFFSSNKGSTPTDLVQHGIYNSIALALKGGSFRRTSLVLLAKGIALAETQPPKWLEPVPLAMRDDGSGPILSDAGVEFAIEVGDAELTATSPAASHVDPSTILPVASPAASEATELRALEERLRKEMGAQMELLKTQLDEARGRELRLKRRLTALLRSNSQLPQPSALPPPQAVAAAVDATATAGDEAATAGDEEATLCHVR